MSEKDKALSAVKLALASFGKNPPRYNKDNIEQARAEAIAGLELAVKLLEKEGKNG